MLAFDAEAEFRAGRVCVAGRPGDGCPAKGLGVVVGPFEAEGALSCFPQGHLTSFPAAAPGICKTAAQAGHLILIASESDPGAGFRVGRVCVAGRPGGGCPAEEGLGVVEPFGAGGALSCFPQGHLTSFPAAASGISNTAAQAGHLILMVNESRRRS
jgi:hypothetical protein